MNEIESQRGELSAQSVNALLDGYGHDQQLWLATKLLHSQAPENHETARAILKSLAEMAEIDTFQTMPESIGAALLLLETPETASYKQAILARINADVENATADQKAGLVEETNESVQNAINTLLGLLATQQFISGTNARDAAVAALLSLPKVQVSDVLVQHGRSTAAVETAK
jgi:hypothetical protein